MSPLEIAKELRKIHAFCRHQLARREIKKLIDKIEKEELAAIELMAQVLHECEHQKIMDDLDPFEPQ